MLSNYNRHKKLIPLDFFKSQLNSICPIQSYLSDVLDNSTKFNKLSLFNLALIYFLTFHRVSHKTDYFFHRHRSGFSCLASLSHK